MLAKIPRPSRMAPTIVAKLSSARIMSAASLATSVPVMPIATPMSAALSAGASFTPSPVIATIRRPPAARRRSAACAPGRRARRRETSRTVAAQRVVVERLELGAGDDARAGRGDAEVGGDPRGGLRVVAGDHQHAHAGGVRVGDRGARLRPRRVDHADQAEEDELALDRLVLPAAARPPAAAGRRRRACAAPGRRAGRPSRGSRRGAPRVSGRTSAADALVGAAGEQHVGRALGDDGDAALALAVGVQRAHQLALGGERDLADPLEPRAACSRSALRPSPRRPGTRPRSDRPGSSTRRLPRAARRCSRGSRPRAPRGPRRAGPGRRADARPRAARPPARSRCR